MKIELTNFNDKDWERVEEGWTSWWAHDIGRPMVIIESLNSLFSSSPQTMTKEFLLEKPAEEVVDYWEQFLVGGQYYGDAWPKWFPNYGPGLMAGFLGSKVVPKPDQRTVWFEPEEEVSLEDLRLEYNPDNVWWKRILAITRTAVDRWGDSIAMAHTDLGGNLDIISSFRTAQQLLFDLVDAPEEVDRLVKETTAVWLRYYDDLDSIIQKAGRGSSNWAAVWSPKRTYMTQSDFCYMISPDMFERWVAPDLEDILANMEHGFYHLDGKGQLAHLDRLLAMKDLAGIQWIPGGGQPPTEDWPEVLKKIIDGGKLCQVYVTPEGARKIVKEIGGKGFALYIAAFPPMDREQADDFLKQLAEDDINPW